MQFRYSDEVALALESRSRVFALESTVITHGLPYPINLETANRLEAIVREGGAVPATIAVFDAEFFLGLDPSKIERLANKTDVQKTSRRDLAIASARRLTCAT